jgi:NADH-quinone oxidoreductase subunit M
MGKRRKEYSAMKLTLMLMGGSAFLLIGILGIYFGSGASTMNLLEIAALHKLPSNNNASGSRFTFLGFGVLGALFLSTPGARRSCFGTNCRIYVAPGVLMNIGGYGCFRIAMYLMPEAANELSWIFLILTGISVVYGAFSGLCTNRLEVHQRLLVS